MQLALPILQRKPQRREQLELSHVDTSTWSFTNWSCTTTEVPPGTYMS